LLRKTLENTWGLGPMLFPYWLTIRVAHINFVHINVPPTLI
jgi:hypothetical protein